MLRTVLTALPKYEYPELSLCSEPYTPHSSLLRPIQVKYKDRVKVPV